MQIVQVTALTAAKFRIRTKGRVYNSGLSAMQRRDMILLYSFILCLALSGTGAASRRSFLMNIHVALRMHLIFC